MNWSRETVLRKKSPWSLAVGVISASLITTKMSSFCLIVGHGVALSEKKVIMQITMEPLIGFLKDSLASLLFHHFVHPIWGFLFRMSSDSFSCCLFLSKRKNGLNLMHCCWSIWNSERNRVLVLQATGWQILQAIRLIFVKVFCVLMQWHSAEIIHLRNIS